jgi:predicted nuclease with TOPRIM domain
MPEKNRIEDINKKFTEAAEERKELMAFLQKTYYSVENLTTQIKSFKKRVEGVEARVGAIEKGRIVGLEGRMGVLEDRLAGLEGKTMKDMEKVDANLGVYGEAILWLKQKVGGEGTQEIDSDYYMLYR